MPTTSPARSLSSAEDEDADGEVGGRRANPRLRLLGLLISVAAVAGVVAWALGQQAPQLPDDASSWGLVAAAICSYALATALRSERWLALLRADGWRAPRRECYGLTAVGFMGNNVLPARAGDGMRAYYMARYIPGRIRDVASSLIAERVLDVLVLVAIYALVGYALLSGIDLPTLSGLPAVLIGAVVVVAAALAVALVPRRVGRLGDLRDLVGSLARTTRGLRGAHGARMAVVTVLIWGAEALTLILAGAAVGFEMTPLEGLYLVGLAGVFLLVPSGPGYAGTFDAAMLFGAAAIGASGQLSVSFLLAARFVDFVPITIVGLGMVVARYGWGERPT